MVSSNWFDTKELGMVHYIYIKRGPRLKLLNDTIFLSQKILFVLANSVDPDEMWFHLGVTSIPRVKASSSSICQLFPTEGYNINTNSLQKMLGPHWPKHTILSSADFFQN